MEDQKLRGIDNVVRIEVINHRSIELVYTKIGRSHIRIRRRQVTAVKKEPMMMSNIVRACRRVYATWYRDISPEISSPRTFTLRRFPR